MLTSTAILAGAMALFVAFLVFRAWRTSPPQVEVMESPPPAPDLEWRRMLYDSTTKLYIEVDREIWQIATIFTTASTLVMGWVVVNMSTMRFPLTVILGSASIILVGIATLFKHRLREFNLVHVGFLRRLERSASMTEDEAKYWGLQYARREKLKSKGKGFWRVVLTIHGVMDVYFVIFILLWFAVWTVSWFK